MKRNIILIMIITVFMKFLGFGREIALTYFYGASSVSDVYLIAQTIPNTLFALVGSGLATTFIPIFNRVREEKGEKEAKKFSSNVMNFVVILSVMIIIVVLIFTSQVVRIFASGFTGATMELAVTFTRISIFGIIFAGLIYILNAYLQLKNKFIIPALISLPMNLVIIFSFVVANKLDDIFLAYGIVASIAIQLIFVLPSLIKNGFKYSFILDFKDVYLREMILLSLPVILGSSVNQLNVLVDKNIASNVAVGGISALNYAYRLSGFIQGLFVVPIITVIYPNLSKKVIDKDNAGLEKVISDSIIYISLLVIPATIGAMALARPIIELLFLRGEFDAVAASLTTSALFFYAIGMLGFALRDVFSRVFYAYNDTKTPTINAMIGVAINIILNLILSRLLGIGGLALATSLSAIITTALLIRSLRIKEITFGYKNIIINIGKIIIASLVMGAITLLLFNSLKGTLGNNVTLIIAIGVGAFAYLIAIILLRISEVKDIISGIKSKVFKK